MRYSFIEILIALAVVILFPLMLYCAYQEAVEWQQFKQDHACKVVARTSSTVVNTISSSGKVGIAVVDGQTGWLCDDGVTYYK